MGLVVGLLLLLCRRGLLVQNVPRAASSPKLGPGAGERRWQCGSAWNACCWCAAQTAGREQQPFCLPVFGHSLCFLCSALPHQVSCAAR